MDDIKRDIETLEWYFGTSVKCEEVAEAWINIKERLQSRQSSGRLNTEAVGQRRLSVEEMVKKIIEQVHRINKNIDPEVIAVISGCALAVVFDGVTQPHIPQHGQGKICPTCGGSGFVDLIWPNDKTICSTCSGTGKLQA
jgi:hypothetical protein